MTPDEARDHAMKILEAAEAAEMDEVLVTWLTDGVKMPLEEAAKLLVNFRELRDKRVKGGAH